MTDNKKIWANQHEYNGFLRNALAFQGSVTPKVLTRIIVAMIYACAISFLYCYVPMVALPIGPFEYAGFIMGLILVFRVNAGYDRWWEARKIWGDIINHSRNLAIVVATYTHAQEPQSLAKIMAYVKALPFLIKNNLRSQPALEGLDHLLNAPLRNLLSHAENQANVVFTLLAHELNLLRINQSIDGFAFLKAEEQRASLVDSHGACERILKTPMPFVMAVKSRRFIFLFLLVLPCALVKISVLINPFITGLVAYALFSLDQIGVELQNPFDEDRLSHLPLNDMCRTIEKNINEIQKTIATYQENAQL